MTILFANNATTLLAGSLSSGATSATVTTGTGALFPSPTGGNYFVVSLFNQSSAAITEICHCTNVTGDVLTLVRAQEGTSALAWNVGDILNNELTAGQMAAMTQAGGAAGGDLAGTYPNPTIKTVNSNVGSFTNASVTVNAKGQVTAAADGPAPAFTTTYTSSLQAISTSVTVAHGLGAVPFFMEVCLHCISTELGFSVGDEVPLPATTGAGEGGGTPWALNAYKNATTLGVEINSTSHIGVVGNSGTSAAINPAKWNLIFRACL